MNRFGQSIRVKIFFEVLIDELLFEELLKELVKKQITSVQKNLFCSLKLVEKI